MQSRYKLSAVLLLAVLAWGGGTKLNAQSKPAAPGVETARAFRSLNADAVHPIPAMSSPAGPTMSPAMADLVQRLQRARRSNDVATARALESDLAKQNGSIVVPLKQDPNIPVIAGPGTSGRRGPSIAGVNNVTIANTPNWAIATATDPTTGRIWVATSEYGLVTDTIRIYDSGDNGQTWGEFAWFYFGGSVHFRSGELDIEIVNDGTDIWLFGVVGASYAGSGSKPFCELFRFNTTSFGFFPATLDWPGVSSTSFVYNPRLTSDNSVYTNATYIYIGASFDSTAADSSHWLTQKYAVLTSPFVASPTITYSSPSPNGVGFFWDSPGMPAGTYLSTDIAYYNDSGTDRIMTVYSHSPLYNLYLAWSDNYGAANAGSLILVDSDTLKGARLAFNGGFNNLYGMIIALRRYQGSDWDTKYWNTTTGGLTSGDWSTGYFDYTSRPSLSCDVVAVRDAANLFKVATTIDTSEEYGGFDGYAWDLPYSTILNSFRGDETFGTVRAGYKIGAGDDGFAIWAGSGGGGVYASSDFIPSEGPWRRKITGQGQFYAVAVDPLDEQVMYGASYTRGMYKSVDGGNTWAQINNGLTDTSVISLALCPAFPDVIYCGGLTNLYVSPDAGASWTPSSTGITDSSFGIESIAVDPTNPSVAYAAVYNGSIASGVGLYKTTDRGASWTASNTGVGTNKNFLSLAINPLNRQVLYAGTSFSGSSNYPRLYKSTDAGSTWVETDNGLPTTLDPIRALSVSSLDTAWVLAGLLKNDSLGGAYLTQNGGANWYAVNNGLPAAVGAHVRAAMIRPGSGREFYVGLGGGSLGTGGVFRSTDAGASWTDISGGDLLNSYTVRGLAYGRTTGRIFAAGAYTTDTFGQGVFVYQAFPTSVPGGSQQVPLTAQLYQNYPNPFNPSTTIRYSLSRASRVTLRIYNILGQEVATLLDGDIPAGVHEVRWNAGNSASGVYFYRIQSGSFVETRKLLLLK